jgi:5-methylcytosine-specific restriction endonuclease McrA
MRAPCRWCQHRMGVEREVNGQDTVRCAECDRFQYNRPKIESGRKVRSISERPDIKPARRARIFALHSHACVGCGAIRVPLHLGHLLSVKQGRELGASDELLMSDDNLAPMCAECNLGFGETSVAPALMYRLLLIKHPTGIPPSTPEE